MEKGCRVQVLGVGWGECDRHTLGRIITYAALALNLGSNPEGSALFLLGMQNSIAHALPRPALEGRCGDMWGVKLKAGPEPA